MIDFQLLGALAVHRPDGAPGEAAARRHPLALLAIVAAAAPQPVARDKLMALLWPESDSTRASNSLRQALYALRSGLGGELFLPESAGGLQLDPRAVAVDLWAFREALGRDAPEEAVRVYRGPLLDGFSLPRAAEFGRWVDTERDQLARQYLDAVDLLARRASEQGRVAEAVSWRRRQAAGDPFSSEAALALMKALVHAGDRPGALQHASVYATTLRMHLEVEPDPVVVDFVAALRRELYVDPRTPMAEASPPPPAPPPALPTHPPRAVLGRARPRRPGSAPRRVWLVVAALTAVLGAAVVARPLDRPVLPSPLSSPLRPLATAGPGVACTARVAEAERYTLLYALPIPEDADYQGRRPPYAVDRSAEVGPFDRVAYCLQLDADWLWVSMDAYTHVPAHLGVPVAAAGATFQQKVANMNVFSNVPGVVTGTGIRTGSIEFWHQCYDEGPGLGLAGANSVLNDFDDVYPHSRYPQDSCYGSMQVHNHGARQTVFAYNQWDRDPEFNTGPDDLGIGNSPGAHPDWTFEANADRYRTRTLYVLVRAAAQGGPR